MKRYVLPLFVLLVACIAASIWLEHVFGEACVNRRLMFQRSGALVVLLGIAYGFVDAARYAKVGEFHSPEEVERTTCTTVSGDHVRTPARLPSGRYTFPNNQFGSKVACPLQQKEIEDGRVSLGVITVSHPHLVPIIEAYLHALHVKLHNGRLPDLSLQIG